MIWWWILIGLAVTGLVFAVARRFPGAHEWRAERLLSVAACLLAAALIAAGVLTRWEAFWPAVLAFVLLTLVPARPARTWRRRR